MIIDNGNLKFDFEIPLVIIGAGACGLCAAISAKDNGIRSIVLERDKEPSGSTSLSTCLIPAAGSKLQKTNGINDSPKIFAKDIINKAKKRNDNEIAEFVAEKSGPTVDWLIEENKVPLNLITNFYYPGHSKYRMHGSPNRTGKELMSSLLESAKNRDIDILTSSTATNIFIDNSRNITGVEITRPNGAIETVGCKSLILACNGFGGNKSMVKKYIPEMSDALYFGHYGNKGDAIKWGLEIGASVLDMGSYQGHGAVTHPHGTLLFWGLMTEGGFQVNISGNRFVNEVRGYSEQAVDVISQKNSYVWQIWDSRTHKMGLDFTDYRNGIETGAHKTATSVQEISEATKMPLDNLKKTFEDIEYYKINNITDNFKRNWSKVQPMIKPYYFAKVTGALFHTQGGLNINKKAEVLDNQGKPFPNLFAGGGAARGLSGPSRWGYLSGNGLLSAIVFGKIAGTEASKKIKKYGS